MYQLIPLSRGQPLPTYLSCLQLITYPSVYMHTLWIHYSSIVVSFEGLESLWGVCEEWSTHDWDARGLVWEFHTQYQLHLCRPRCLQGCPCWQGATLSLVAAHTHSSQCLWCWWQIKHHPVWCAKAQAKHPSHTQRVWKHHAQGTSTQKEPALQPPTLAIFAAESLLSSLLLCSSSS